jgi:hypothetical protein
VGVLTLPVPDSKLELHLVASRFLNALGEGDYFQGLPGTSFRGSTCLAADDLAHPLGDPAEASTAAALDWIAGRTGSHRPIPGPPAPEGKSEVAQAVS